MRRRIPVALLALLNDNIVSVSGHEVAVLNDIEQGFCKKQTPRFENGPWVEGT